jgi:sodium transport system permease protein
MLWLRTLIEGDYIEAGRFALPVIGVTAVCAWMAIRWAERQFHNESVLFRESERIGVRIWLNHLLRDREDAPSVVEAFACGMLVLLITFFGGLGITVPSDWPGIVRIIVVPQVALIAAPALIMAVCLTRRPAATLLLNRPPWLSLPAAFLLAVVFHPAMIFLGEQIQNLYPPNEETLRSVAPMMAAMKQAPWWQVLLVFALTPAICEELAYRGFILSGLRGLRSDWMAILISSVFFGVTHGMLQQSLTATAVGVVIGFVAVRTGSLLPCVIFHATHNSISVLASRLAIGDLAGDGWLGWFIESGSSEVLDLHYRWPATLASVAASALLLIWFRGLPERDAQTSAPAQAAQPLA